MIVGAALAFLLALPSAAQAGNTSGGSPATGGTQVTGDDGEGNQRNGDDDGDGRDRGNDGGGSGSDANQGLAWPTPGRTILSPFGENRGDHLHAGLDISAAIGTPIRAAAAGRVIYVGSEGGYGMYVCIAHSTITTCYAHLSQFRVKVGDPVGRGDVIGLGGCTGNCHGAHLHFEVRMGTRMWAPPTDPARYLPGARVPAPAPGQSHEH